MRLAEIRRALASIQDNRRQWIRGAEMRSDGRQPCRNDIAALQHRCYMTACLQTRRRVARASGPADGLAPAGYSGSDAAPRLAAVTRRDVDVPACHQVRPRTRTGRARAGGRAGAGPTTGDRIQRPAGGARAPHRDRGRRRRRPGARDPARGPPRPSRAGPDHAGRLRADPRLEAAAARGRRRHAVGRGRRARLLRARPPASFRLRARPHERPRPARARDHPRSGRRPGRRRERAAPAARLRHAGARGRQQHQRLRRAGGARALPVPGQPGRGRAHPPADPRPLPARPRRGVLGHRAPAALRDRRRRRHRGRARGRAPAGRARAGRLWPARLRSRTATSRCG